MSRFAAWTAAMVKQQKHIDDLLSRDRLTEKEVLKIKKRASSHLTTYCWDTGFPKVRVCSRQLEMLCDMAIDSMPKQELLFKEQP